MRSGGGARQPAGVLAHQKRYSTKVFASNKVLPKMRRPPRGWRHKQELLATVATNAGQTTVPGSGYFLAQKFETAGDGVAFEISGTQVDMGCNGSTQTRVMVREDNDNEPGGLVAYLTNPEPLTTGSPNAYPAPGGPILDPTRIAGSPYPRLGTTRMCRARQGTGEYSPNWIWSLPARRSRPAAEERSPTAHRIAMPETSTGSAT